MESAVALAIISAGVFFLVALLTGVWKYLQIRGSKHASAHPYVDIAHRASLMYSFAAILLARFAEISQLSQRVEWWAVLLPLLYFAYAILLYIVHGALKDTENQLKPPFRMGSMVLPPAFVGFSMWSLIIAEIGGFLVLFYGVLVALMQ
jgi:Ca2+/Na+ antiporter